MFSILLFFVTNEPLVYAQQMAEEGLRDIKGPESYPLNPWWIVLFSVLSLIVLIAVILSVRKKLNERKQVKQEIRLTSWQKAYQRLDALDFNLISQKKYKQFYSDLSEILRAYFEERFAINALDMTTEEFFNSLKNSTELSSDQKQSVAEFMYTTDMIKFAKQASTLDDAKHSVGIVRAIVDQTKKDMVQ